MVYSRKLFPKSSALNNTNIYFDESYSPQLLKMSSKSIDLMQTTNSLLIHVIIEIRRVTYMWNYRKQYCK